MKKWLFNLLLSKLFKVVTKHDLLERLGKDRQEVFKAEARVIRDTDYWKWFMEDMELLTERKMFSITSNAEHLWFGKGMLYCLEMMETNMKDMAEGKIPMVDNKFKKAMRKFKN